MPVVLSEEYLMTHQLDFDIFQLLVFKIDRTSKIDHNPTSEDPFSGFPNSTQPYAIFTLPAISSPALQGGYQDNLWVFAETFNTYEPTAIAFEQKVYDPTMFPFTGQSEKRAVILQLNYAQLREYSSGTLRIPVEIFLEKIAERASKDGDLPFEFGWETWLPQHSRYTAIDRDTAMFVFGPQIGRAHV